MNKKVALITGINGQDGSYLAEFLLTKGYEVHGTLKRNSVSENQTARLDNIFHSITLHYADLTDLSSLISVIKNIEPDEIYNLATMSHVKVSFDTPEYTANADGIGTLRILEAIRLLGLINKTRIYQASTSELYGLVQEVPQTEKTAFYPRSPYGVAKLYAYWITVNYREAYNMHASNGILFNHESPIRGETFVTRKITRALARIVLGMQQTVFLGNLSSRRDWGHAKDYIRAMHLILQQDAPDDYVIATGITTSIRDFIKMTGEELGIEISFTGENENEKGFLTAVDEKLFVAKVGEQYLEQLKSRIQKSISSNPSGEPMVAVDPQYFRPTEVELLIGDATKSREKLGWIPKYDLKGLISDMIHSDVALMKKDAYLREGGYRTLNYFE